MNLGKHRKIPVTKVLNYCPFFNLPLNIWPIFAPEKKPLMDIFSQIEPLTAFLEKNKSLNKSVGFVPTMGALHNGHLALIANSRKENEASATDEFRILINQLS